MAYTFEAIGTSGVLVREVDSIGTVLKVWGCSGAKDIYQDTLFPEIVVIPLEFGTINNGQGIKINYNDIDWASSNPSPGVAPTTMEETIEELKTNFFTL